MNEHSITDSGIYRRVQNLTRNLKRRYHHLDEFSLGLLLLLASEKLLRNYYRTNVDVSELAEWRELLFKNIEEFKEDISKYKIKVEKE